MAQVLTVEGNKAPSMKPEQRKKRPGAMMPCYCYEAKMPEELDRTDGEIDNEVELLPPISASLGAMVSLSRKLDAHLDNQQKNEIGELRTRLLKLSMARDPPVTARIWSTDVRELSYDMDNCVDAQMDWIDKLPGFLARVKEASGRYDRYMLKSVPICTNIATADRGLQTVDGWKRQDTTLVVGIHVHDGPFDRLCHLLTDGDEQLKVLSVFGVAGIGKTTLAKQIWREHKLRDYFHCAAVVRTAKKPDMRRILRSILAQVRPHQPPDASEVHELIDHIREHLQDKRYFLIIDDLWAISVWDVVTRAFPEGTHGSRIITTTEIEDVALACCSYQSRYIFKMEPLSDSHSKELFTSAVFGSRKEKYRQIDEVSDEIIRRCEGLPQAIVSISSVLASLGEAKTVEIWEEIQNSLPTNTTSEEKLKQVLFFCYRCLPSCLQTCLLYLSFYPENYILLKEDIMKQWVAEGFICGPTAEDKMEVAGSYFDKLVNMGLIQHIDVDYSNEVQYYAVHHIVHDIITSKSTEENFITVLDYSKRTTRFSNKVSRLSLQFGSATYAATPASTGLSQVRSLAFIGLMSCFPSILEFKLLRFLILHIWGDQPSTGFNLGVICDLLLLRYLQVTCNDTVHLPDQMQGLKHLETIEINARIEAIPSEIFNLQSLLHLRLGGGTELPDVTGIVKNATVNHSPSPSGTAISLVDSSSPPDSLQTIELLPAICRMPKWIGQLGNLCILKIVVREMQRNDISDLQGLPALTLLSLHVQRRTSTEPISFVRGAFAALEYFEFRCGVLRLIFEEGTMPNLQRLNLGFNARKGDQHGCLLDGIKHLSKVQVISGIIGSVAGAEELHWRAAESSFEDAVGKHPGHVSVKREGTMVVEEFGPPEKQGKDSQDLSERSSERRLTVGGGRGDHSRFPRLAVSAKSNPSERETVGVPATDSFTSSPAHHTSSGRSILSLHHRDQIHHAFPPTPDSSHASDDDRQVDAFQRHVADVLLDLLPSPDAPPEILSLDWTRHLLDSFLICLEEFRSVLFGSSSGEGAAASLARPPLDRLLADFLDRAVKALDLCNALRDGIDLLRQWRNHLAIAAAVLGPSSGGAVPLAEGQIRRARKALTDLTILMLDDKDAGAGQRNRSFGRGPSAQPKDGQQKGRGHHRRSSSGSGSGPGSHSRSLSWSVPRSWSASRQLQAIGGNLPVPRANDVAATGGLASDVYTMGAVLVVTAWALVAAIPCQDRGLQTYFGVPSSFPWAAPVTALYAHVLEESKKKERKHSCGLLKEIHQIERCSRRLMEITDAAQFPLDKEKDAEVREAAQELVQVCATLKDGLDPLERQVREMYRRIMCTRTEISDCFSRFRFDKSTSRSREATTSKLPRPGEDPYGLLDVTPTIGSTKREKLHF